MNGQDPLELDRRGFLGMIGAGVLAATLAGALSGCTVAPSWPEIDAIGHEYIARVPAEGTQAALAPFLGSPASNAQPNALLLAQATQIASDYATGDVVLLTGWCFARTECRIAAFYARRPGAPTTTSSSTTTSSTTTSSTTTP